MTPYLKVNTTEAKKYLNWLLQDIFWVLSLLGTMMDISITDVSNYVFEYTYDSDFDGVLDPSTATLPSSINLTNQPINLK